MTSEAIEESAVNVFMFALVLGSGTAARWRFESNPAGANEPSGIRQLKPGRRTAEPTSFTIPLRCHQRNATAGRRFDFVRVCAGSITPKSSQSINHSLTLTA